MVKNPRWQESDQPAIYKQGRGVELGATEKQPQIVVRAGLEPGLPDYKSDVLTTQQCCLPQSSVSQKSSLSYPMRMEGYWRFQKKEGSHKAKTLSESMMLNLSFRRGGGSKPIKLPL